MCQSSDFEETHFEMPYFTGIPAMWTIAWFSDEVIVMKVHVQLRLKYLVIKKTPLGS